MPKRRYRLNKRGVAATETRQRIVETCFDLHARQGIADTTMTQIAKQAGVSVGTVYHHFPSYEDAIAACGAFTEATVPPPRDDIFDGLESLEDRVAALVAATFGYFNRLGVFALIRADRRRYEIIDRFAGQEAARRRALTRAALAPFKVGARQVQVAAAMIDVAVHDELRDAGFTSAAAAAQVATMICAGLRPAGSRKSPRARQAPSQPKDHTT